MGSQARTLASCALAGAGLAVSLAWMCALWMPDAQSRFSYCAPPSSEDLSGGPAPLLSAHRELLVLKTERPAWIGFRAVNYSNDSIPELAVLSGTAGLPLLACATERESSWMTDSASTRECGCSPAPAGGRMFFRQLPSDRWQLLNGGFRSGGCQIG